MSGLHERLDLHRESGHGVRRGPGVRRDLEMRSRQQVQQQTVTRPGVRQSAVMTPDAYFHAPSSRTNVERSVKERSLPF